MKKTKDISISTEFIKNLSVIAERRKRIVELEAELKELKNYKFEHAINYFNVLKCRGRISDKPTKSNGYSLDFHFINDEEEA
jgi:predicted S18 family serine protease